ncbi:unannotated protein [freshwater metagenome]|uniref:Unannotated protein n=1 Tax=freshwater metagenome TaxID=449393 RepID=A0A6J7GA94_9ZZZZ
MSDSQARVQRGAPDYDRRVRTRRPGLLVLLVVVVAAAALLLGTPRGVPVAAAASCSDYATQAAAQDAADTRDGDADGRLCESLPCPCAGPGDPGSGSPDPSPAPPKPTPSPGTSADPKNCRITRKVVRVGLSRTKYPEVRAHWERAIAKGWPRTLKIHRKGAERRRSRLLAGMPTRPGKDRDEYPPASARTTVKADVEYVDSAQNRGAGSVQGVKLRRYCSGQRFIFVWY